MTIEKVVASFYLIKHCGVGQDLIERFMIKTVFCAIEILEFVDGNTKEITKWGKWILFFVFCNNVWFYSEGYC